MLIKELLMTRDHRHASIGVGVGTFLGVWRIFARISANLPEKIFVHLLREYFLVNNVCGMISKNQVLHVILSAIFTKIKARLTPFLLVFSGLCPDFQGFCEGFKVFYRFFPNFGGFCLGLHQIRTFLRNVCTPCTPVLHHSIPVDPTYLYTFWFLFGFCATYQQNVLKSLENFKNLTCKFQLF